MKLIPFAAALLLVAIGCAGPMGPAGPAGEAGAVGAQGPKGDPSLDPSSTYYRVAVDISALANLPPSCFLNNTVPTIKTITTNLRAEQSWNVWTAADNKQYLDVGNFSVTLGHADPVVIGGLVEGSANVFSAQIVQQKLPDPGSTYTYTKTTSAIFTLDSVGETPKGTIDLSSQYTCTSCTNNDNKVNCAAKLTFNARRQLGFNP
jgi:hypothetical protein